MGYATYDMIRFLFLFKLFSLVALLPRMMCLYLIFTFSMVLILSHRFCTLGQSNRRCHTMIIILKNFMVFICLLGILLGGVLGGVFGFGFVITLVILLSLLIHKR